MIPTWYLDIETAGRPDALDEESGGDPEARDKLVASGWGALSPWTGLAVHCSVHDGERVVLSSAAHCQEDEARVLSDLYELLETDPRRRIVAHYSSGFDFPFLRVRALRWGLPELSSLLAAPKPWDTRLVDSYALVPTPHGRASKGWHGSLDRVAALLGIPVTPTLPGAQVPAAWHAGDYQAIREHCDEDVRVLSLVYPVLAAGAPS